jgi:predicted RNA-binding protein
MEQLNQVIKMCESTAYSTDGSLIMEDVLLIKIEGNQIHLTDILNQKKVIKGTITEINLDKHGIYIDMK